MGISTKRSLSRRVKKLIASTGVTLAALGTFAGASLAMVPDAAAAGTYCSVRGGGCQLFAWANTGGYYFTTPGKTPAGMLCWEDGQWTNLGYSTNRWFKMTSSAYGIFWAPASEVINQTKAPHC